jgi:hypothetical protein
MKKKKKKELKEAHACKPSYLGGENLEDQGSRPPGQKKIHMTPSQQKKAGRGGAHLSSQLQEELREGG